MAAAKDATFGKGERVCWSHLYATQHAPGSVVFTSAVEALAPDGKLGTVKAVANDEGTYFDVLLDGEKTVRTFTADELVKVVDDA